MKEKQETLEELQEEFNNLTRKRNHLIVDVDETTKKLIAMAEKIYEHSPDYVRVVCPNCNGKSTVNDESGKLVKCICYPKGYVWMRVFKEAQKKDDNKSSEL